MSDTSILWCIGKFFSIKLAEIWLQSVMNTSIRRVARRKMHLDIERTLSHNPQLNFDLGIKIYIGTCQIKKHPLKKNFSLFQSALSEWNEMYITLFRFVLLEGEFQSFRRDLAHSILINELM